VETDEGERRRIQVFGSLGLLVFLVNFGRVVFAPLLDHFITVFGVGEATVGLVATLAWFGSAAPRLPAGYLLTRYRRHHVILATGLLLAAAATLTAMAQSIWHVGFGAFVIGTTSGIYFVAANPLVSELFPDRVGRVIGIHGTASQLAAVVAPLLIGAVVIYSTWRVVFVGLGVLALVGTVGLFVTARRAPLPDLDTGKHQLTKSILNQWRIVLIGIVVVGTTGFVWNGFFNFFVRYLTTTKGIEFGLAQTFLTLIFAAGVPAFFYGGRLADRVSPDVLRLAIMGGFTVSLFLMTVVEGRYAIAAMSIVMGFVIHTMFPAMDTFLLGTLPDADRSSAYAAYSAIVMLMSSVSSVVVGTLVEWGLPFDALYRFFAAFLVVVLFAMAVLQWVTSPRRGLLRD